MLHGITFSLFLSAHGATELLAALASTVRPRADTQQ
jgi:hypothetical protein